MTEPTASTSAAWLATVDQVLTTLVSEARTAFRDDLRSIVLFGSAAEGRLRPTSDLNLVIVLRRFERERADAFREPLRVARAAGRASVMFLLESEVTEVAEAFAVKFDDIERRRKVLFGDDVFAALVIPREAMKQRLRQMLLNLELRLRERYLVVSLREEQLVEVLADAAGPLRVAAASLLELEGQPVTTPREALARVAQDPGIAAPRGLLETISTAREQQRLPAGVAAPAVFQLLALIEALLRRADKVV